MRTFFRVKYEMVRRMLWWGWNMRYSYDWDAHSIYHMLYLKLGRTYEAMKNGNCLWSEDESSNRMRKLLEAKGLAKRAYDEKYSSYYSLKVLERYTCENMNDELRDELYPESKVIDEKMWSAFFRAASEKDKLHYESDVTRLHCLLTKYVKEWWD